MYIAHVYSGMKHFKRFSYIIETNLLGMFWLGFTSILTRTVLGGYSVECWILNQRPLVQFPLGVNFHLFFFCTKRKVLTIQNYQIIKLRLMKENIPRASILPENAAYNKWQFQALVTSNRTENQFHLNRTKKIGQSSKGI